MINPQRLTPAVAISTTADEHRLEFLETCVQEWWRALASFGLPTRVFVTVDGDQDAFERAMTVSAGFAEVLRVGQPLSPSEWEMREGRLGVAVNKNTGLEALMRDAYQPGDLFLSDDDTWPLGREAIELHANFGYAHSLVCWGRHRASSVHRDPDLDVTYGEWSWPRGSAMYVHRHVVESVGGMIESFGPGGHEHVEWSRRIHQTGFTPAAFVTPPEYNQWGAMGMARYWHAEDAPKIVNGRLEPLGNLRARRRALTSIRRTPHDWPKIEAIMKARDGDTSFVPYSAVANGRQPATMYPINPRQGAEEA